MKTFEQLIDGVNYNIVPCLDSKVSELLCNYYISKSDDNTLLVRVLEKFYLNKNYIDNPIKGLDNSEYMWEYALLSHIMKIKFSIHKDYLGYGKQYMKKLLIEKNKKYGDAILNPFCFFSSKNIKHTVLSRLDEKMSRLLNNTDGDDEDIFIDIMGYLYFAIIVHENNI